MKPLLKIAVASFVVLSFLCFSAGLAKAQTWAAVAIYNYTGDALNFQVRAMHKKSSSNDAEVWTQWIDCRHDKINGGGKLVTFDASRYEKIEIRFDETGDAQGKYDERKYSLPYTVVTKAKKDLIEEDGTPYYFEFRKDGSNILEFKRLKRTR